MVTMVTTDLTQRKEQERFEVAEDDSDFYQEMMDLDAIRRGETEA